VPARHTDRRPRSSVDRAADFESACGGSIPPGAISSRLATANPHGYAGQVCQRCRECAYGAYPGAYLRFLTDSSPDIDHAVASLTLLVKLLETATEDEMVLAFLQAEIVNIPEWARCVIDEPDLEDESQDERRRCLLSSRGYGWGMFLFQLPSRRDLAPSSAYSQRTRRSEISRSRADLEHIFGRHSVGRRRGEQGRQAYAAK
jgi:hypothetical protein